MKSLFSRPSLLRPALQYYWNISQWTECYEISLFKTLSAETSTSSEIFYLKAVIIACCLCLYVCAGPELETPYEQAPITALRQNISFWRAGPERNESMKMCKISFPTMKYWSIKKVLNIMKSLKICVTKRFSKLNAMKTAWWCVMIWINVFCEMYWQ